MAKILVVDDEVGIRELLSEILQDEGHDVVVAENAAAARSARKAARPDLVLLDIWMPDTDGISLLKEWAAGGLLTMPVVMMSGHGTIDTAVEATRIGALDFLEKPISLQKLLAAVKRGLALEVRPKTQVAALTLAAFPRSVALRDLRRRLEQVVQNSRCLMLRVSAGHIGELCARSVRPGSAWLDIGSVTLPLEVSVLERHVGGVLYVGDLPRLSRLQQKNLAFALDRLDRYQQQLVCVSDSSQDELLHQGWDPHLVTRLGEVTLALPSLGELRDEIPDLAVHLLEQMVEAGEVPVRRLESGALNLLRTHPWPGGLQELRSTIKSLALAALEEGITVEVASSLIAPPVHQLAGFPLDMNYRDARDQFDRIYFEYHLRQEQGHMTRLAERTGLERTHLYRKLKQLGIATGRRHDDS